MSTSHTAPGDSRPFADELERYREAQHLTNAEMARAIGASTSQMSRWRHGGGISLEHLERVAVWMDRPLHELMPLAGYPAALTNLRSDPADPRFQAVRSVWDRLDDTRKQIIQLIAISGTLLIGLLTPHKRALKWGDGLIGSPVFPPLRGAPST